MTSSEQIRKGTKHILLVEDESSLAVTVADRLESEGYVVTTAGDGEEAETAALSQTFDLIVLDVMLPKKNGFDVCRDLRQRNIQIPILMLTARTEVVDRVVGLKLGADDYLTKPFEMIELLARIETLLRRAGTPISQASGSYRFGEISVDFRSASVSREGKAISLSALEFRLLKHFIENRGAVLSRDELLDDVWGYDAMPYTRTVDAHVASLRQKLEPSPTNPQYILTVHGLGYRFVG